MPGHAHGRAPFHGDFFNAWNAAELERRVRIRINGGYIRGTDGNPIQQ